MSQLDPFDKSREERSVNPPKPIFSYVNEESRNNIVTSLLGSAQPNRRLDDFLLLFKGKQRKRRDYFLTKLFFAIASHQNSIFKSNVSYSRYVFFFFVTSRSK